jgi:hypothetical protein
MKTGPNKINQNQFWTLKLVKYNKKAQKILKAGLNNKNKNVLGFIINKNEN